MYLPKKYDYSGFPTNISYAHLKGLIPAWISVNVLERGNGKQARLYAVNYISYH